jgi:hypothetical protein
MLAGVLGLTIAFPLLWISGSLAIASRSSAQPLWLVSGIIVAVMAGAGGLYGRVFMRAANDPRGGWLFGISYGFLIWMLGPVTLVQWALARQVVIGGDSRSLFTAHLLYGLVLGLAFPAINRVIQSRARASTSDLSVRNVDRPYRK